eukprot:439207_1
MKAFQPITLAFALHFTATWITGIAEEGALHSKPMENNVVVIGGGLAGVSAAIEAYESGAYVTLLEKQPRLGGNSAKATSGINGLSNIQKEKSIKDSHELFFDDTLKSGNGNEELVSLLVGHSGEAVQWLTETFGLNLSVITQLGGHSARRTHRFPPDEKTGRPVPVGFTIMMAVQKWIQEHSSDRLRVVTNAIVKELQQKDSKWEVVYGTEKEGQVQDIKLMASSVVFASGGFAYDRSKGSLLHEFAPEKLSLPTTSGPQATGDGVRIARALGAKLLHMDQIQVHPTGLVDPSSPLTITKFLAPEAMRGEGGILVTKSGERFTNELGTRLKVTQDIFKYGWRWEGLDEIDTVEPPVVAYMLMNDDVAKGFGRGVLDFYKSKGLVKEAENGIIAAQFIGASPEVLENTLREYSNVATGQGNMAEDKFGKTVFPVKEWNPAKPINVAIITPAIHYTMGGVAIDPSTRVLKEDGTHISGLFAAGEVTGGVHNKNRLGGNSLIECVVFGRYAGKEAAKFSKDTSTSRKQASSLEL